MATALPDYQHPDDLDLQLETEEKREAFRVHDDSAASWAIRKLARIRDKQAENKKIADAEIERIKLWLTDVNHSLDNDAQYFEMLLLDYARRQRAEDGRKSIVLPHGKVSSRSTQPKWTINDEELMPWAKANMPDLIIVKESVSLSACKEKLQIADGKAVSPDGEFVPGVIVSDADLSFTITTE